MGSEVVPMRWATVDRIRSMTLDDLAEMVAPAVAIEEDGRILAAYVALAAIKALGLYKTDAASFEKFAFDRWGIGRSTAYRWVAAGDALLDDMGIPKGALTGHPSKPPKPPAVEGAKALGAGEPAGQHVPPRDTFVTKGSERAQAQDEPIDAHSEPVERPTVPSCGNPPIPAGVDPATGEIERPQVPKKTVDPDVASLRAEVERLSRDNRCLAAKVEELVAENKRLREKVAAARKPADPNTEPCARCVGTGRVAKTRQTIIGTPRLKASK